MDHTLSVIAGAICVLAYMHSPGEASDAWHYKTHTFEGDSIVIDYSAYRIKLTPVGDEIIRIQLIPNGSEFPANHSYAVLNYGECETKATHSDLRDALRISFPKFSVTMNKSPFGMEFTDEKGQVITRLTDDAPIQNHGNNTIIKYSTPPDERFYGFGLQFHSLNQRGKHRIIKTNADTPIDNGKAHAPAPFFISSKGYGVFVDDTGYTEFDMACSNPDDYSIEVKNTYVDMYFIYGGDIRSVLAGYTMLTGRPYLPPKWGLGLWYRMHHEWNADKTIEVADHFRSKHIPCDVIGLEPGWQTHAYSCSYVWNKERFPDPPGYVRSMREKGFRLNLWEHAYVHPSSPVYEPLKEANVVADKEVWGGLVPDFSLPKAREIFTDFHIKEHVNLGVAGYKLDECNGSDDTGGWFFPDDTRFPSGIDGCRMHNIFGFLYQQTMHEMYDKLGIRTYLLVRGNFAGAQRYPSCIYSDYYGMDQYIRASVNSGFSGVLWCPEVRQTESDEEFIRRSQLMFFSPLAMINAWADGVTPWEKGPKVESIFKKYAELRMQLIPYIYTAFKTARDTGIPLVRALVVDYPNDSIAAEIDSQFMFGGSFMVAPIISGSSREVYFPRGTWVDFWTGDVYSGNTKIQYSAPLETIPLFVKSGAIIPMYPAMNYVGERPFDEITFMIYPAKRKTSYVLYEDDGETNQYLEGVYATLRVECEVKDSDIEISIGKPKGAYELPFRTACLQIHSRELKFTDEINPLTGVKHDSGGVVRITVPIGSREKVHVGIYK